MTWITFTASLSSIVVFSVTYIYFLGLRIIRNNMEGKTGAFFLTLIVGCGVLTATVTFEAVLLIGLVRQVSGSLFYVATFLGSITVLLSTAGIAGLLKPIKVALAHRKALIWGLGVGNGTLLGINILSFCGVVPSVL